MVQGGNAVFIREEAKLSQKHPDMTLGALPTNTGTSAGRDKDVPFYRISKVVTGKGESIRQLTTKRHAGSTIQRLDLTQKIICNNRICSTHLISGKPAALEYENIPDWLPTLHLGHSKAMTAKKAEAAQGS